MASRRENGEGCIYKRKDGRWIAEIRKDGKRRSYSGKTQQEVRYKLKEAIRDLEKNSIRISVRLDYELYEEIKTHSVTTNEDLQNALIRWIKQGLMQKKV